MLRWLPRDPDSLVAWYVAMVLAQALVAPLVLVGTAGGVIWAQAYIYVCGSSVVMAFWAWIARHAGMRFRGVARRLVWCGAALGLLGGAFLATSGAAIDGFRPATMSYIAYFGSAGAFAGLLLGLAAGLAAHFTARAVRGRRPA